MIRRPLKFFSLLPRLNFPDHQIAISSANQSTVLVEGQEYINLTSSNYFQFATNESIIKKAVESLDQRGFGISSARYCSGTNDYHLAFEETLANFHDKEAAMTFHSGTDANCGIIEVLFKNNEVVLADEECHPSIKSGLLLAKSQNIFYKHNDMEDLENHIKSHKNGLKFIITDGVFEKDGSIAKLDKICDLAKKYEGFVIVDDCHGIGVLGDNFRGSPEDKGVL